MSRWTYQAIRPDGSRAEGEIEARSRSEALQKLDASRLQPLSVRLHGDEGAPRDAGPGHAAPAPISAGSGSSVLSRREIVHFTKEISTLLDAGLQLEPALRSMARRRELSRLKGVVEKLQNSVREGANFSAALRKASPSFDELYCRLAEAGEISGALPKILRRQAAYLATMNELRNRVIQALVYPAFLCGAGAILVGVFMTVLVPQLVTLFSKTGQQLPPLTRLLIAFSGFLGAWWWLLLALAMLAVLAFWRAVSRPAGRLWWDRAQLRLPLVGEVIASRYYVQFAQTLATMVANGIPLLNALRLMHAATANRHLHALLGRVVEMVQDGKPFTAALQRVGDFPPAFIDMVGVGEQTGDMAAALENVGARYDEELNVRIQRVMAVIQPVLIALMALAVGVVAYSMVTGIFQSVNGIGRR